MISLARRKSSHDTNKSIAEPFHDNLEPFAVNPCQRVDAFVVVLGRHHRVNSSRLKLISHRARLYRHPKNDKIKFKACEKIIFELEKFQLNARRFVMGGIYKVIAR